MPGKAAAASVALRCWPAKISIRHVGVARWVELNLMRLSNAYTDFWQVWTIDREGSQSIFVVPAEGTTSKSRSRQLGAICMTNVCVCSHQSRPQRACLSVPPSHSSLTCMCVCVKRLAAELQKFYKSSKGGKGKLRLGKSFCVCFQLNAFE